MNLFKVIRDLAFADSFHIEQMEVHFPLIRCYSKCKIILHGKVTAEADYPS